MFRSDPTMSKWFDTTRRVTEEACRGDAWPEALKQCIVSAGSGSGVQGCQSAMPRDLHAKMEARLRAAM
jgi:hypothetical protein